MIVKKVIKKIVQKNDDYNKNIIKYNSNSCQKRLET